MSIEQDFVKDSRIAGFYRMTVPERIDVLRERNWLDAETAARLKCGAALISAETADRMIENVIGVFGLPLAVAPNFRINGRDYVVPMVVEEPSIVAAVSGAAKMSREAGGFTVRSDESLLVGQILLTGVRDPEAIIVILDGSKDELVRLANSSQPNLARRGGGVRGIDVFHSRIEASGNYRGDAAVVVHLLVDTCDAMGANIVNSMCEAIAPRIEELTSGTIVLRILSNLADRSLVTAGVTMPLSALGERREGPESIREAIVLATRFAHQNAYRAATHNKGIMNGIDAVAVATGNDWRAIEAAAHAYAARDGAYRSLTTWTADPDGNLAGELVLPLKVGIVGGSLGTNPAVGVSLQIAGVTSAAELASLMAAVGLAQNFAALRALVTEGIQKGHMRLHARSVAAGAGTPSRYFGSVVDGLVESGDIKVRKAKDLLAALVRSGEEDRPVEAHGRAAGKVILLGEHAAVYGRHALALPIEAAVSASVRECATETRIGFRELRDDRSFSPNPPEGVLELVRLIVRQLGMRGRQFEVHVESNIPRASGLGSSAAVAVAVIRAFDHVYAMGMANDAINDLAFECEKLAHGDPSGIDNSVATFGKPILYSRARTPPMETLALRGFPPLVIAASGKQSSTKDQVEAVRRRHATMAAHYDAIFDEIDALSIEGAAALVRQEYGELGLLMNLCHGLLNALEVSTPELERMVDIARRNGAAGAKLTGAGGGGSIVALCPEAKDRIEQALRNAGYQVLN